MTTLSLAGRAQWIDFRGVPANWDVFYASAAKAGIRGAIRYISSGSDSKQIHSPERQAAGRHGIKLLLVDELGTGDAWDSADDRAAGAARGRAALADAKREGFGPVGISAAADAHASGRQITDAVAYARGFASAVGKANAGMYGFSEVLRAVRAANVVSWYWLAGSKPSAEDAKWIAFWQDNTGTIRINGVECDRNWRLDGPLPGASTGTENDMGASEMAVLKRVQAIVTESQRRFTVGLAAAQAQLNALVAGQAKGMTAEQVGALVTKATTDAANKAGAEFKAAMAEIDKDLEEIKEGQA